MRIAKWTGLLVLAAACAGGPAAFAQTGGFSGHVTLQNGSTCVGCLVTLDRQSVKGHYQVKTNKKGDYLYIGLPLDTYKLTLYDLTGKPVFYITKHMEMGEPTQVDFNLPKEAQAVQKANPELAAKEAEQQKQIQQMNSLKTAFNQASALEDQKQYAQAAAAFKQAEPLAKEKNLEVVLAREADSYRLAQNYDQAVATYQRLLTLNPENPDAHSGLGNTYSAMGKFAEAEAECDKSSQGNPSGASKCYYNVGVVANNSGHMDDAAAAFKKATELDPTNANAFFLEGQALMGKATMQDNKIVPAPGTVEALQAYLKLDPNGPYASTAQSMLQSIQGTVQTEFKVPKKKKKS
jgi:tetratricopeptide (TPR) repeat protein